VEQSVGDGGESVRSQARQCTHGRAEQRIGAEAPEEFGVVVVEGEHEARAFERFVARRAEDHASVDGLVGRGLLAARQYRAPGPPPEVAEPEDIAPSRADDRLDHPLSLLPPPAAGGVDGRGQFPDSA
jgi:hypothetical protein